MVINLFKDNGPCFAPDDLIVDEIIKLFFVNRNFHFQFKPREQNIHAHTMTKYAIRCVTNMAW